MNKRVKSQFAKKRSWSAVLIKIGAFWAVASFAGVFPFECAGAAVSSREVWKKAEELGRRNDIDPLLIYSIACAESSLDDRADSGQARGIMQVSHVAWKEVTKLSYEEAWAWETNMEVAAKYLHVLRRRLENTGHYSWPLLAAAYHYGPNKVVDAGYKMSRLPRERNKIYKQLLAGRLPRLPGAVPYREIDRPAAIQAFARAEPTFTIVLPMLDEASYDEIPDEVPDVLEIMPLTPFMADAKIWAPDDADEIDEARILEPLFFHDPDLITPLPKVPDLESLFVIRSLGFEEACGLLEIKAPEENTPVALPAVPDEEPPEITVVEPAELDTSVFGIVKPTEAENSEWLGITRLKLDGTPAPEE